MDNQQAQALFQQWQAVKEQMSSLTVGSPEWSVLRAEQLTIEQRLWDEYYMVIGHKNGVFGVFSANPIKEQS